MLLLDVQRACLLGGTPLLMALPGELLEGANVVVGAPLHLALHPPLLACRGWAQPGELLEGANIAVGLLLHLALHPLRVVAVLMLLLLAELLGCC